MALGSGVMVFCVAEVSWVEIQEEMHNTWPVFSLDI